MASIAKNPNKAPLTAKKLANVLSISVDWFPLVSLDCAGFSETSLSSSSLSAYAPSKHRPPRKKMVNVSDNNAGMFHEEKYDCSSEFTFSLLKIRTQPRNKS